MLKQIQSSTSTRHTST